MVAWRKPADRTHADVARPPLRALPAPPLPLVRRDTLPEHTDYRDTGCDLAPSCLRCPFARCKYDGPPSAISRDREIALLRRRYRVPVGLLAETYGLSRRSIFRILRGQSEGS